MTDHNGRFACKCCGKNLIDPRVVELHLGIEQECGEPIPVNSGYRCPQHNKTVGGTDESSHLRGLAWDVGCTTSRMRWRILSAAHRAGIHRIGIRKDFIHLDIDRQKDPRVVWIY